MLRTVGVPSRRSDEGRVDLDRLDFNHEDVAEGGDEMVLLELSRSKCELTGQALVELVELLESAGPGTINPRSRRAFYELAAEFERAAR